MRHFAPPLLAALLGSTLLAGCVEAPPPRPHRVVVEREYVETVAPAPPPTRVVEEVIPEPRQGYVWVHGHWHWDGHQYVAVPGHWELERRGYHYVPGHWESHSDGWHWRAGVWVEG